MMGNGHICCSCSQPATPPPDQIQLTHICKSEFLEHFSRNNFVVFFGRNKLVDSGTRGQVSKNTLHQ